MLLAVVTITPEPGEVREVCEEVGKVDRNDRPGLSKSAEAPTLLVHDGETFEEGEDQSIGETGEEGQAEDDRLAHKHVEGSDPNLAGFFGRNTRLFQLVGSIDIGVFSTLTAALGFAIDQDGGTTLGHEEDDGLRHASEDELDPEEPLPIED